MKLDDDNIYVYMLVRYNKKTGAYRKCRIFYIEAWANNKCIILNRKNIYPEKYSFHVIKYLLVKV